MKRRPRGRISCVVRGVECASRIMGLVDTAFARHSYDHSQ